MPADAMPRTVIINPWDKRIGPNRYLVELLRQIPELAQNSIVILPAEGEAADEYRSIGCRVEVWQEARLVHLGLSAKKVWRMIYVHTISVLKAWHRLRAWRAQLVLTNSENVWVGGITARLLGVPHLQVSHALTLEYNWGNRRWLALAYLRFLSLWSTRFVAVSQTVARMLTRYGVAESRVAVVPNGLNLESTVEASRELLPSLIEGLLKQHSPILVSFGRISSIKGHDLLVEAFAQVRSKFPNALLLCAGALLSDEGLDDTFAFNQRIQQRVRDLGLDQAVVFLGEIDYAMALLCRADVYIQPSRTESFCRAVAEAAILRVPVAAFDVGGIREVLGAQGGVFASPENPAALADAVIRLLSDSALRHQITQSAYQNVSELFDVRRTHQLFLRLIVEAHCARVGK